MKWPYLARYLEFARTILAIVWKIGQVYFHVNTNSKKALLGPLWYFLGYTPKWELVHRGHCRILSKVSNGILTGLTDEGNTWVTIFYKFIVLLKKIIDKNCHWKKCGKGGGFMMNPIFSSPEPKAHWWANSIPVTSLSVRPSVVCRPSVNIFKHLLLWNHWANWTQISYGDSLGYGNESLFNWFWSHDQDGRHAHIW